MNLSSLSPPEFAARLRAPGIFLQTGVFIVHVQTAISNVAESMERLYADYPLADQSDFADFHVSLGHPTIFRKWFRPQVCFKFDGRNPFKPLPFDQAFPMLEWGLNWCISSHANRYLIIHAAVIEKEGCAAVLPAPPGAGKSTLCAALIHRGWRLLSDELALIRLEDAKIVPLPRPVSLKNGSIELMHDYVADGVFSRKVTDTMKGAISHLKPPVDSVRRATELALPGWVIFPKWQSRVPASLQAMPRSRAFMRIAENAFNFSVLGSRGFETLSKLIDASLCYNFTYSTLDDAVEIFSSLKPPAAMA